MTTFALEAAINGAAISDSMLSCEAKSGFDNCFVGGTGKAVELGETDRVWFPREAVGQVGRGRKAPDVLQRPYHDIIMPRPAS